MVQRRVVDSRQRLCLSSSAGVSVVIPKSEYISIPRSSSEDAKERASGYAMCASMMQG
jgi:hypothetical protein